MKKRFAIILCLALAILMLAGCKATSYENATDNTAEVAAKSNKTTDSGSDGSKIIKRASIDMETEGFDKAVEAVNAKTKALGGYIESSSIQSNANDYKYADFTLRIPSNSLETFLKEAADIAAITGQETSTEDISGVYSDTKGHLIALRTEEQRLLALLAKGDNLDTILKIENRLSEVRYDIESYTGTLNAYDSKLSMSSVSLHIKEVGVITKNPDNLWENVVSVFKKSLAALVTVLKVILYVVIALLPFAAAAAVIGIPIMVIVRRLKAKRKAGNGDTGKTD